MRPHKWKVTPREAIRIQERLSKYINLSPSFKKIKTIVGVDCAYKDKFTITTAILFYFPSMKIIETCRIKKRTTFPYIPTLLTFREGPTVLECLCRLKIKPACILFDGQGIAHPRRMGLATHMGIPSIGCAKNLLTGGTKMPGGNKGNYAYIRNAAGEIIGMALRTRKDVKPVYVSAGHLIDLKSAAGIVLACSPKYRIPEPLRLAHTLSVMERKFFLIVPGNYINLSNPTGIVLPIPFNPTRVGLPTPLTQKG